MTKTYRSYSVTRRHDGVTIHTGSRSACLAYAAQSVVPRAGLRVAPSFEAGRPVWVTPTHIKIG
jgi:hypothetical protein